MLPETGNRMNLPAPMEFPSSEVGYLGFFWVFLCFWVSVLRSSLVKRCKTRIVDLR